MHFVKPAAVALTLAMAATAFAPTAEARNKHFYRHGHHGHHSGHHHGGFGGAFGAGIVGFAAGAALGSLAQRDYYYDDAPRYYYQEPVYSYAPAPVYVSPRAYYRQDRVVTGDSHFAACDARYRSYDPGSDTFMGYDGMRHRCML
jgi:hypothetical protein